MLADQVFSPRSPPLLHVVGTISLAWPGILDLTGEGPCQRDDPANERPAEKQVENHDCSRK
jgi:hypothetical protein